MIADSIKLADIERMLMSGDAVTVLVRCIVALCSFVLLNRNPAEKDELKRGSNRAAPLLGSNNFRSSGRDFSAASEELIEVKQYDQRDGTEDGDYHDVVMLTILVMTIL